MPLDAEDAGPEPQNTTSLHVRQALKGDIESLSWIVIRFSPLLLAQARYRLPPAVKGICEPEDLVADVWAVALGRLGGLSPRQGRFTPVILKFLSTILLHRANRMVRDHLRHAMPASRRETSDEPVSDRLDALPSPVRDVVSSAIRRELKSLVMDRIGALDPNDREVVILRAVEQRPGDEVARLLGTTVNAVHVRYHRAIERLRGALPGSVFDELGSAQVPS
jgi:RNA polymerase sigma factor (sigma-70 family)